MAKFVDSFKTKLKIVIATNALKWNNIKEKTKEMKVRIHI